MKVLITFLVVCAVAVGGYVVFVKKDSTYKAPEETTSVSSNEVKGIDEPINESEPFTFNGTFLDLVKKNGSYECNVSHDVSVAKSNGVVYVSGSKIRGQFSSTIPQVNMTVNSTIISDGTHLYTWTDMAKTGFKSKIVQNAKPVSSDSVGNEYMQNLKYSCSPWAIDESKFVIPSDITFIDTNK